MWSQLCGTLPAPLFLFLAAIVLALAGLVHASAIGTERPQKAEKAKKGTLIILSPPR